jgi:hypothetical protein
MKNPSLEAIMITLENLEKTSKVAGLNEYIEVLTYLSVEISKRLNSARMSDTLKFLSEDIRNEIKESVAETIYSAFDVDSERESAWDGTTIQGANEMNDYELVDTYENYCYGDEDELLMRARAEEQIHKLLKGEE